MFFACATYVSEEFGRSIIALCDSEESEKQWSVADAESFFHVVHTKAIAQAVMKAAARDSLPTRFTCNGVDYTLIKYIKRPEERFYNHFRKSHVVRKERIARASEIYVYSERCRCTSCFAEYGYDSIENVCGLIGVLDNPKRTVEIDVQHCKHCGSYFIDRASLLAYEQKYGILQITKRHISGNEENHLSRNVITYKPDTVLSRNGYSTNLYATERQAILTCILIRGIATKAEIKDILTRFISQRAVRNPNAAVAWQNDLEFVNAFDLEKQDIVHFK